MDYKEAITFHKWALPAFLFLCLLLFLTACGDEYKYTTNNATIHNVLELSNICNDIQDDEVVPVAPFSIVTIREGQCVLEVNYTVPEGDENE